jgi:hypothetical protein
VGWSADGWGGGTGWWLVVGCTAWSCGHVGFRLWGWAGGLLVEPRRAAGGGSRSWAWGQVQACVGRSLALAWAATCAHQLDAGWCWVVMWGYCWLAVGSSMVFCGAWAAAGCATLDGARQVERWAGLWMGGWVCLRQWLLAGGGLHCSFVEGWTLVMWQVGCWLPGWTGLWNHPRPAWGQHNTFTFQWYRSPHTLPERTRRPAT